MELLFRNISLLFLNFFTVLEHINLLQHLFYCKKILSSINILGSRGEGKTEKGRRPLWVEGSGHGGSPQVIRGFRP